MCLTQVRLRPSSECNFTLISSNYLGLQSEHVMAVDWEKTILEELDITATELSTECLIDLLTRVPALRYLSAGQQDRLDDLVLREYMERGSIKNLIALDLDRNANLSEDILSQFVRIKENTLQGLQLSGIPHLTEQFWNRVMPLLKNLK